MSIDSVAVLLWDCDGVLQHGREDWCSRLDRIVRPGFAERLLAAEVPALRGECTLREVVEELLEDEGRYHDSLPVTAEDLLAIWDRFDLDPEAIAVLRAVREQGVRCLLATNQQDHRVQIMRRRCGYDDLVDGSYYSSEVGAMKPDPAFFAHILADLEMPAEHVGFVDDLQANVDAARSLGIRAVRHEPAVGAAGLASTIRPLVPGV